MARILFAFCGIVVAAVVDLLVNLIASAVEGNLGERVLSRSLWLLIVLALVGMGVGAWLGTRAGNAQVPDGGTELRGVTALWSKIKTRGGGVRLRRIFSIKSTIDVDTRRRDADPDD